MKPVKKLLAVFLAVLMMTTSFPLSELANIDMSAWTIKADAAEKTPTAESKDDKESSESDSENESEISLYETFRQQFEESFEKFFKSSASAENTAASAPMLAGDESDDYYTWSFDESTGTLTISGSGAMPDFLPDTDEGMSVNTPWFDLVDDIKSVVVEEGITEIGNYSFVLLRNMTTVKLPESLTRIGDCAFAYCFSLEGIDFPTALNTIGDFAFGYCLSIKKFTYHVVENMGEYPFIYFLGVEELTIPAEASSDSAFQELSAFNTKKIYNYSADAVISDVLYKFVSYEYADYFTIQSKISLKAEIDSMLNGTDGEVDSDELEKEWIAEINKKYGTSYTFDDSERLMTLIQPMSTGVPDYCDLYCLKESAEHNMCLSENYVHYNIDDNSICTCSISGTINGTDTWSVSLDTKTLTLGGSGTLESSYMPPYVGYSRFIENVKFDDEAAITGFGAYSFALLTKLETLTIPEGVTSLGNTCFLYSGIKTLNLPATLSTVKKKTFQAMTDLEAINVAEGSSALISKNGILYKIDSSSEETSYIILKVPEKAFGSQWLSNASGIESYAFDYYVSTVSVDIPEGVTSIGERAFYYCANLTSVTIPNSVTSIAEETFYHCASLTSISLGSGVSGDIYYMFYECPKLTEISISDENENYVSIDGVIFSKDKKTLIFCLTGKTGEYVIPNGVESISDNAFNGCSALTSITIPGSVTSIGSDAFNCCENLTSLTIPDSVTSIGSDAFDYCDSLTSINIGSGVTNVYTYWFSGCYNLAEINISGENKNYSSVDGVLYNKEKTMLMLCPKGKSGEYVIPDGVTNIDSSAFCNCNALTSITVPDSVTKMGSNVFNYSYNLASINIGSGISYLDYNMIQGCSKLTKINISDENETYSSVDGVVFNKAKTTLVICPVGKSGEYVVPDGVTSIGDNAFRGCEKLTSVTIPSGVTSIGNYAFYSCINLTNVTIPSSVTSIGNYAFNYCRKLESLAIPAGVTSIGSKAFDNCSSDFMLYVSPDTAAENYAIDNGIAYKIICLHDESSYTVSDAVAATCTTNGYTAGIYCNECEKWIEGHETLYAHHTDEDGDKICDICGEDAELSIKSGQTLTINVGEGETVYIAFKPLATGTYSFTSISKKDTYGYLYDANKTEITSNDDGGGSSNFKITYRLEKGTKYYFGARYYSSDVSGNFDVKLTCDSVECEHAKTTSYDEVPATCTESGYTAGVCCDDCGEWISGHLTIEPHHTYEVNDAACDVCGTERAVKDSGTCGDNAAWTLYDDGVLVISGTGSMSDYAYSSKAPWYTYRNDIKSAKIKDGITNVGNYAFYYCTELTSVTIPEGVTSIDASAFFNCQSLTGISIPDSVTNISNFAFCNCGSLTSITIPDGVTNIGNSAFSSCGSLTSITIPNSVTSIGSSAFKYCDDLATVNIGSGVSSLDYQMFFGCYKLTEINISNENKTYSSVDGVVFSKDKSTLILCPCGRTGEYVIPDGVTSIGAYAFYDCNNLTSVTIPEGVTSIGAYAFYNCKSLTSISIPDSVTSIGYIALGYCKNLKTVNIGSGLSNLTYKVFYSSMYTDRYEVTEINVSDKNETYSSIGGVVFSKDKSTLILCPSGKTGTYVIPDGVKTIESYSFCECSNLTSITIPNTVENINSYAFYDCNAFMSIAIPDSVTTLADNAFYSCDSLTTVDIGSGISSLNYKTFYSCPIVEINVSDENETYSSVDGVVFSKDKTTIALCPGSKSGEYVIPSGVTIIGDRAFRSCNNLTSVTIPDGVTSIGDYAFSSCNNLTSVTIPGSVTSIGNSAFSSCYKLTSITIPGSVKSIGNSAFNSCNNLTSVTIADGVTSIGDSAFSYCYKLTSITIPGSVTSIGDSAFYDCDNLTSVTIADGVTSIGNSAFEYCDKLTSITIPGSVTSIGRWAFDDCDNLADIFIINPNCKIYDSSSAINYTATIHAHINSTAKSYADKYNKNFEKIDCSIEYVEAKDPTCTKEGNTAHYKCTVCEACYSDEAGLTMIDQEDTVLTVIDHKYTDDVTEPTCTKKGYTVHTCSVCGYSCTDTYTAALGHDYSDEWTIDVEADCTTKGSKSHHCSRCTSKSDVTVIAALGHSYGDWTTTLDPTCTAAGKKERTCSACGNVEYGTISALGHDYSDEWTIDVEADCTTKGSKSHHCSRCTSKSDVTVIAALGHSYGEWTTTLDPTCTAAGKKERTCSTCSNVENGTISALGHKYTDVVTDPTCTANGYTTHTCSVCGNVYKDSTVSAKGHVTNTWTVSTNPTCTSSGSEKSTCEVCKTEVYRTIAMLGHDFGEWTVEKEATVLAEGLEVQTCSRCSARKTRDIDRIEIDINENENYGLANFTVVNAQTLEPINGASIFISTENDGENTFFTDENGEVSVVLPVGELTVSAYAQGCLTRNLKINVESGENDIAQIGLSDLDTYDAKITSKPMDQDEIEAAGISTSNPENKQVYKYELQLDFGAEVDIGSIFAYFNANGDYLGGGMSGDDDEDDGKSYRLHYHVGGSCSSWCKSEDVEKGQNVSLSYTPTRSNKDYIFDGWYADQSFTEKITSVSIDEHTTKVYGRWIYTGEGSPDPIPFKVNNETYTVYPVSENFWLIVHGDVQWLKEMFDVEMLIINNSNTDTLENLTATLELPEGLSLAAMANGKQSSTKRISKIAEGESRSVHWYVRGDTAGSYALKAKLKGTVMPFNEPIDDVFYSDNQLHVWAGNALNLNFAFPNTAYYGEDYPMTITLTNVSDTTLYNVNHKVKIEEGMRIYYSDETTKEEIKKSKWESVGIEEFKPGDKLIIEVSTNIFFKSEIMQNYLDSLCNMVTGIETLLKAYEAVNTALSIGTKLVKSITNAAAALALKDDTLSAISSDKKKAVSKLYSAISSFYSKYGKFDNKSFDSGSKLATFGIVEIFEFMASDNVLDYLSGKSIKDIDTMTKKILTFIESFDTTDDDIEDFDIFDSIRTMISAIPICYALNNVTMVEDENNTTRIPWSYTVTQAGPQYFGVSNVSSYISNITAAIVAEIWDKGVSSNLGLLSLIPAIDDPFNYDQIKRNIIATEKEIEKFQAKDSTGAITFKSYYVENTKVRSANSSSGYVLECDNDTAVFENGVLTFTGEGMISFTPLNTNGGTLYIEDSEGNTYTYEIDVVEQHECKASEEQRVVIAPTDENDGFAVKCCETCGDIMDIVILSASDCTQHDFSAWTTETEATCTSCGVNTRSCSVCGYTETDLTDSIPHIEKTVNKVDATCTKEGYSGDVVCETCGETISTGKAIKVTAHKYTDVVTEPTCTKDGYTTHTCSVCGDNYTDSTVKALGHTGGKANCKDKAVCTTCGKAYGKVDSSNHKKIVTDKAVAATCTTTGLTQGKHCEACGKVTVAQKTTEKLGHDLSIVSTAIEPTCDSEGQQQINCSRCSYYEFKSISATGHHDDNSDGICDGCGYTMDSSLSCDCMCHKSGFSGFIWKILCFFYKIFKTHGTCDCGKAHY